MLYLKELGYFGFGVGGRRCAHAESPDRINVKGKLVERQGRKAKGSNVRKNNDSLAAEDSLLSLLEAIRTVSVAASERMLPFFGFSRSREGRVTEERWKSG